MKRRGQGQRVASMAWCGDWWWPVRILRWAWNWNLFDLIENGEFSFLPLFPFWVLSFSLLIIRVNDDGRPISSLIAEFTSLILPRKSLIALENTSLVWCFTHLHFFIYIHTIWIATFCMPNCHISYSLIAMSRKQSTKLKWSYIFLCSSSMIPWRP